MPRSVKRSIRARAKIARAVAEALEQRRLLDGELFDTATSTFPDYYQPEGGYVQASLHANAMISAQVNYGDGSELEDWVTYYIPTQSDVLEISHQYFDDYNGTTLTVIASTWERRGQRGRESLRDGESRIKRRKKTRQH